MKKVFFVVFVLSAIVLAACGGGSSHVVVGVEFITDTEDPKQFPGVSGLEQLLAMDQFFQESGLEGCVGVEEGQTHNSIKVGGRIPFLSLLDDRELPCPIEELLELKRTVGVEVLVA